MVDKIDKIEKNMQNLLSYVVERAFNIIEDNKTFQNLKKKLQKEFLEEDDIDIFPIINNDESKKAKVGLNTLTSKMLMESVYEIAIKEQKPTENGEKIKWDIFNPFEDEEIIIALNLSINKILIYQQNLII